MVKFYSYDTIKIRNTLLAKRLAEKNLLNSYVQKRNPSHIAFQILHYSRYKIAQDAKRDADWTAHFIAMDFAQDESMDEINYKLWELNEDLDKEIYNLYLEGKIPDHIMNILDMITVNFDSNNYESHILVEPHLGHFRDCLANSIDRVSSMLNEEFSVLYQKISLLHEHGVFDTNSRGIIHWELEKIVSNIDKELKIFHIYNHHVYSELALLDKALDTSARMDYFIAQQADLVFQYATRVLNLSGDQLTTYLSTYGSEFSHWIDCQENLALFTELPFMDESQLEIILPSDPVANKFYLSHLPLPDNVDFNPFQDDIIPDTLPYPTDTSNINLYEDICGEVEYNNLKNELPFSNVEQDDYDIFQDIDTTNESLSGSDVEPIPFDVWRNMPNPDQVVEDENLSSELPFADVNSDDGEIFVNNGSSENSWDELPFPDLSSSETAEYLLDTGSSALTVASEVVNNLPL